MSDPIPVLFSIDVEPDPRASVSGPDEPWGGFERMVEWVHGIRPRLAEATGRRVRFNWFLRMDEQIKVAYGDAAWVATRYADLLDELRSAGDAFGIHPHPWRWDDVAGRWRADYADPSVIEDNVRTSFEAFQQAFGEPPVMNRAGDRFMSRTLLGTLRELGIEYDLTLEPGRGATSRLGEGELTAGVIPDQRHVPTRPYLPDPDDPFRANEGRNTDGRPWMVPMTALDPDALLPAWRRVARRVRHPGGPFHRPVVLFAPWDATRFWRWVEAGIDASPTPYLSLALRSSAPLDHPMMDAVVDKFETLIRDPYASRLTFTEPGEAIRLAVG